MASDTIDVIQAAQLARTTVREIYAAIDRGELPAYKINRRVRLLPADVRRWHPPVR